MDYKVFTPSPELQPFIKCFWSLESEIPTPREEEPVRQRVVPDGCMEMIFHYGDHYQQFFEDGSLVLQPRSFVFGQITRYIEIAPTGVTGIISARFHPEGLTPFLDRDVSALQDKAVALEELFGEKGSAIEKTVLALPGNEQRIQAIESFLLSILEQPQATDNVARSCVEVILQSQGQLAMQELAGKLNLNRRNMERRFISAIGMSPKQLARVVRLQATLKMLEQKKFTSLTSLAYENGYYDQAHFIKDFREFTGMSPKSFYAENLRFAALFASAE
jgi:AraC-like DNA-binding protein